MWFCDFFLDIPVGFCSSYKIIPAKIVRQWHYLQYIFVQKKTLYFSFFEADTWNRCAQKVRFYVLVNHYSFYCSEKTELLCLWLTEVTCKYMKWS